MSDDAWTVSATGVCSRADTAPVAIDEAPAAASAVAASAAAFTAFGLPAPAGCCTRPFWAVAVVASVADASVVSEVVALRGVAFGATGAVAATFVANAAAFTADVPACVAGWFAGAATVWPAAAVTAIFAVVAAVVVVVSVVGAAVAVAAFGSVVTCADDAAWAEMTCELAAIAAAAIASGAVALPEAGAAAGVLVATIVTGITTATGVGVATDNPACWARMVGSTAVASPVVEVAPDFVVPDFPAAVFVPDDCVPSVLAVPLALLPLALPPLASEDGPELLPLLLGSLLFGWLAAALFAGPELLSAAGGGVLSERLGAAGGGCCCAVEAALLLSEAVLLSTNDAKMSFPGAWSRAGRCAAPWKDTFAATSELTLTTGRPLTMELDSSEQGPGHPFL